MEGDIHKWSISDLSPDKISNVEADCYWCLSKLLDGMQDHYTFAQPGIQRLVFKLKELVNRIDGNHFFYVVLPVSLCFSWLKTRVHMMLNSWLSARKESFLLL